ncbi:huntingtin-like isoform X3 [Dinothrombium tinctorium]|uniref:Huntingtin-like isoform X3 n=1 Tax=Dinothrombium tinctorium TaxID=1965070 RepID=A0A3S3QU12_9ACAR|nr:huntingtin-like isoform X3 [Dinothrombium tinctorium]RWS13940.1 huntingtin-like isoform X3 [Dinothrombium tinctorium]
MSSIEKLVKSFEALKVLQTTVDKPEEAVVSTKFIKKETSLTKKDKINHCSTIAEIIVSPQLRTIEDFHKFLGIAIETFLVCCDDNDSDVRLAANECLNKTIKSLIDTQLGRIEVELYKEIKKNGSSRSIRASLSRFADLCYLIRPTKCRPYFTNLLPCLMKISQRTEEDSIQETLGISMIKLMRVFGRYATDGETKLLMESFIPNLQYTMASVRRTATISLVSICQYSKKPTIFYSWLLTSLLKLVNNAPNVAVPSAIQQEQHRCSTLAGVFLCFKYLVPLLQNVEPKDETSSFKHFSMTLKQKEALAKELDNLVENLLQMYELLLHTLRTTNDHSVTLSALEALHQLLKTPPKLVLPFLLDSRGIDKSRLGDMIRSSIPSSPCVSQKNIKLNASMCSSTDNVAALEDEEELVIKSLSNSKSINLTFKGDIIDNSKSAETPSSVASDNDIMSNHSNAGSFENIPTAFNSHAPLSYGTPIKFKSQKFNLNKLTYVESEENLSDGCFSPSTPSLSLETENFKVLNIGDFLDSSCTLEYCTRLLCSHFLLTGTKGGLVSDKSIRVSVKSLVLSCLANIFRYHPESFVIDLHMDTQNNESVQKVWDVVLYSSHPDPHLRGQVAVLIGNFTSQVLSAFPSYNDFLLKHCSVTSFAEAPTLEDLICTHLLGIVFDAENSSVCIRHGLIALQTCLISIIHSNEALNNISLGTIYKLVSLKNHNYWLVKVEVLELISKLPFAVICYLEKSLSTNLYNDPWILKDDDHRVRQAAANSLTRLVKNMFIPEKESCSDAVTAVAANMISKTLKHFSTDISWTQNTLSLFPPYVLPPSYNFAFPFVDKENTVDYSTSINSNLKNIVTLLMKYIMSHIDNKYALYGVCSALSELSDVYIVTKFPDAWCCDLNSVSNCLSFIKFLLSLTATNSTVLLDLTAHQTSLHLIGNLISGLCYQSLKSSVARGNYSNECDLDWGLISKDASQLVTILESLTAHLLKLLNLYANVIEETNPFPSNSSLGSSGSSKTPVIQSLSNTSLSPIRRKASKNEADKNETKKSGNEKEKERTKKTILRQNSFASDPLMHRLYDTMKSIHYSSKISMDMSRNKLSSFLGTVLQVLSQVLEVGTLKFIGKYAEELLEYLKSVIVVEPSASVFCVRQLLKCIFGTNFATLLTIQLEIDSETTNERDRGSSFNSTSSHYAFSSPSPGLYQTCFALPYAQFSQYYSSKSHTGQATSFNAISETAESSSWHCFFRKNLEKRFASILDKVSSKNNSSPTQSSKMALTSHIRLFEPVVIKALKLYTMTSDTDLQCEVLSLLSHLVKLRVNYCLLDSDQIFVGFVLKQFEFIENGQIVNVSRLINQIFQFLILLSYERYHSKPIISVPKIIQMCDNLMASGELPTDCVIPALIPFAEDLFLHRGPSKVDSIKELEAQREVITATLLKLIHFPRVIEIFVMIVNQSRKESEEKWRKISRQVIDAILPLLIKQQIIIDEFKDLEILHQLFDTVSPVVFRPVDYLLNVLFSNSLFDLTENDCLFHRWFSTILVILRVLIVQAKEEVVLARLEELHRSSLQSGLFGVGKLDSHLTFQMLQINENAFSSGVNAEKIFADFLLNIIQLSINQYKKNSGLYNPHTCSQNRFLEQQLSCFLLYLTHMCQSGSFRHVAKCISTLIKKPQNSIDIDAINSSFAAIEQLSPTLALQWCNILMILGYDDNGTHEFWYKLVKRSNSSFTSPVRSGSQPGKSNLLKPKNINNLLSVNYEIIKRGALILLCDFVCENMNDAEQLTWLIINNIKDIVQWSYELPIRDFIYAVHRNQASSGLFLQAINARCDDLADVSFLKRLLNCVKIAHSSQSGSLVALLIEQIITNPNTRGFVSLKLQATELALERLDSLIKQESLEEMQSQLSIEDTEKLITLSNKSKEMSLYRALNKYKQVCSEQTSNSHPLLPKSFREFPNADRNWFLSTTMTFCKHRSHYKDLASTFIKLSYEELNSMFEKKFDLNILSEFIEMGGEFGIDQEDTVNAKNSVFTAVVTRNNLLKFSITSALDYLNQIQNYLPPHHYPFLSHSEVLTPKEAKHRDKLIDLFNDKSFSELLSSFSQVYIAIIKHAENSKCIALNRDTLKVMLRIGVLYAELAHWEIEKGSMEYLSLYLTVIDAFFRSDVLTKRLNLSENVTFQCSVIASIFSIVQHYSGELREICQLKTFQETELTNPEWKHCHKACLRVAELVYFLESNRATFLHGLPLVLSDYFYHIIISLSRLTLVNSFIMVPPLVWKQNIWSPNFIGDYGTICSTIPSEQLRDGDLLNQFIFRIKLVGWSNRIQFEEIWMSLFGVVAIIQAESTLSTDEQNERLLTACMAVNGITFLLLQALLVPDAGNPLRSTYLHVRNSKPVAFLHTKYGDKLIKIKRLIAEKSIAYLSDLFFDKQQYEWMLETFLELFRIASASEDEIHLQFLSLGVCKAAAVLCIDQEQLIDKCKKCVEISLKSSFLPTRLNTLYGLWYLLEQRNILNGGKETLFLPIISDYLLKHLSDDSLPSSHNEEHVTLMWRFAFHLIEHFVDDFAESDFAQRIFQLSLKVLVSNTVTFNVYHTVINGLERLLVCEVFAIKDAETIIKTAIDKMKCASTKSDSIGALSIIFTSLYVFGLSIDNENDEANNTEELLSAMEKIGVIFDRLKICIPSEAEIISSIIPYLLCDFFPTQDVLNKIIMEFLSSQQLNRKYLAHIIFQVFNNLHQQSKESLIHDWVVLSLSSFTQVVPLSLAIWTLSCFLISASSNIWIRSLFPCVQQRIDKFESQDKELFSVVCCTFYDELRSQDHKQSFLSAFEAVSSTGNVYADVVNCIQNKSKL